MTTILVVEDNLTLLESIAFELEMHDYEVVQAKDGQVAIDILEQSNSLPDLIVSDIAMPSVNGYELLEYVRNNDQWRSTPFIFLTAFDSKNAIRIGKGLGVDDYLTKPFDSEDLIIAVENKLKRVKVFEQQAEQYLAEKRRELANLITHELRTPLTAIFGGTDMLTMSLADVSDEATQQYLQLLRSGTNRLNRLVERIVTLVFIDSGRVDQMHNMMGTTLDLNTIVTTGLKPYTDGVMHKNLEFQVNLSPSSLPVRGTEKFLQLILDELLDNAVKFSDDNSFILIETYEDGGYAQLIVKDTGRGIPQDQLDRVWERFVQIDREKYEQQGIGLGLYLVRTLTEAFGGTVDISSQLDKGTQLSISLPLQQ